MTPGSHSARSAAARVVLALLLCLAGGSSALRAQPVATTVPLHSSGAGSFLVDVQLGGEAVGFVFDTGAAMVSIERDLLRRLQRAGIVQPAREVAVRLGDGRVQRVEVQRVARLVIAGNCELRDVEVLVMPGRGRNLLGMNALRQFAPFTLKTDPMRLELSSCGAPPAMAALEAELLAQNR